MRTRQKDEDLRAYLKEHGQLPFAWGEHDCIMFAGKWLDWRTGSGYVSEWQGRYHTALGAKRVIDAEFGSFDLVMDRFARPIPHQLAQPGDIVLAVLPDQEQTHGILDGQQVIFAGADGAVIWQRADIYIEKAWRVE